MLSATASDFVIGDGWNFPGGFFVSCSVFVAFKNNFPYEGKASGVLVLPTCAGMICGSINCYRCTRSRKDHEMILALSI